MSDYNLYKNSDCCRICGSKNLKIIFSLGSQSLTGVFPKNSSENVPSGPVDLVKCAGDDVCGLVQLSQSYNPSLLYGENYGYRSGLNHSMIEHLKNKVTKILDMGLLSPNNNILDIGSNDGTTLGFYPKEFNLYGIDPTIDKFDKYYKPWINKIPEFFNKETINKRFKDINFSVITSFSMFYDLERPIAFAKDILSILSENGIWVFEQSYLPFMLERNSFDTICHEHLEYYSIKQIIWILEKVDMKLIDIEFNEINGGSFSVIAAKKTSNVTENKKNIKKALDLEKKYNLESLDTYNTFKQGVDSEKEKLLNFLNKEKLNGKKIAGLGASTKGNVLLQYYNLNSDIIEKIGEVNPDKFGCYTPFTNIPIVSENEILSHNYNYYIILPWHFKEHFLKSSKYRGKRLIFPLPKFEIIEN